MPLDGRTGLLEAVFKWPALVRGTFPVVKSQGLWAHYLKLLQGMRSMYHTC